MNRKASLSIVLLNGFLSQFQHGRTQMLFDTAPDQKSEQRCQQPTDFHAVRQLRRRICRGGRMIAMRKFQRRQWQFGAIGKGVVDIDMGQCKCHFRPRRGLHHAFCALDKVTVNGRRFHFVVPRMPCGRVRPQRPYRFSRCGCFHGFTVVPDKHDVFLFREKAHFSTHRQAP